MSTDDMIQTISSALTLFADRANTVLQQEVPPASASDEIVEEYVHKLRFYLPADFGNTENNEYMDYLAQTCCENYKNGKYQFSLMAYHMLFMAVLYKEFWVIKEYNRGQVERLCQNNGKFNSITQVFDASLISEKDFIDGFFGVFSWHANKKRTYKEFVDKRDHCAHNSGFIQYDRDDVESYFSDVLRNVEKVTQACEDCLFATYSSAIVNYIKGPSFERTTIVDFINRELSDKKYSYRDLSKLLTLERPEGLDSLSYILSYHIVQLFLSLTIENANYSIETSSEDYVANLRTFWGSLAPENVESLSLQLEYEIEMLEEKGFSVSALKDLICDTGEE